MLTRDDIDIQDAYTRLFRPLYVISKIYINIYIRFMVSQNYTEVHTKVKNIERKKWKYVLVYS